MIQRYPRYHPVLCNTTSIYYVWMGVVYNHQPKFRDMGDTTVLARFVFAMSSRHS